MGELKLNRVLDLLFIVLLVLIGMAIADWRSSQEFANTWMLPTMNDHLGAEYDCIARALRAGRGFADPFQVESGPTAWMPPVLPFVLATLYWLTGDDRAAVIELVLVLKAIVVVWSGWLVITEARRWIGVPFVGYIVVAVALAANFYQLFQITHDEWWLLMLANGLWWGINKSISTNSRLGKTSLAAFAWGAFGAIVALSSPILGAVWALLTLYSWFRIWRNGHGNAWKQVVMAALVSMALVAPWTIRNRIIFERWLPMKSNGAFEVWQSLCLDDDGLLDDIVTAKHPYVTMNEARYRYLQLGEIAFVDEKWPEIRNAIYGQPWNAVQRIANRTAAALFEYRAYSIPMEQLKWPMLFKRSVFPIPFFCVVALLFWSRSFPGEEFAARIRTTIAIYSLTLSPYVLVSYYDRYAAPLWTIKCLLVVYAMRAIWLPTRSSRS